jgi:hypothetical protein
MKAGIREYEDALEDQRRRGQDEEG